MKKVLLILTMAFITWGLIASQVGAFSLGGFSGRVNFQCTALYNWGRLYSYDGTNHNPLNLNPYDRLPGSSIPNGSPGTIPASNDGQEDSYGISYVLQIVEDGNPTNILWSFDPTLSGPGVNNPNNHSLEIFLWGFDDAWVNYLGQDPTTGADRDEIWTVGGHIEVWEDPTPEQWTAIVAQGPGATGRNWPGDPTHYQNVTDDGTLVLDLVPNPTNPYSLYHTFNMGTLSGAGSGIFDVTGLGAQDATFDQNGEPVPLGFIFGADFLVNFNVTSANPSNTSTDWIVKDSPNAWASTPEPGTMLLLGSGLFGLGFLGRRKFRKTLK